MNTKRITAAIAAAAVLTASAAYAAELDIASLSELDFPEEEGINIIDDTADFIELPDMGAELSEDSKNETINISTVEDLQTMHKNMLANSGYSQNKTFVLLNNIDLGGMEWTPIGYNSAHTNGTTSALLTYAFNGIFDGNGYTISNFKITDNQYKYLGFFGSVAGGTVRNLNLEGVSINHSYSVSDGSYGSVHYPEYNGLLVGFSNYATIQNCNVSGSIRISNDTAYASQRYLSSGLVTGAGIAQITNCRSAGSITVNSLINTYCGGIFGNAGTTNTYFRGFIKNCASSASINAQSASMLYTGGIIGRSSTSIDDISECKFTSTVFALNKRATGGTTGDMPAYAGGIAGYSYTPIINCTSGTGAITASSESAPNAGGIAGRSAQRIEGCTVENSISSILPSSASSGTASIGGVAGICGSTYSTLESLAPSEKDEIAAITDCLVTSKVSLNGSSGGSSFMVAGGIVGTLYAPSAITNCMCSSPDVSLEALYSGIYYGGIAGYLNGGEITCSSASAASTENIRSASTLYVGGIAGIARTKRFLAYDMSYGVKSSDFVCTRVYGSHIDSCFANMSVAPSTDSTQYLGGIVGYVSGIYSSSNLHINMDRDLVIERSGFIGDITVSESSSLTHAGGITGQVLDGAVRNCYAAGNIESLASDEVERYIGGAFGTLKQANHNVEEVTAKAENCYAFMPVTKPDNTDKTVTGSFCAELSESTTSHIAPSVSGCFFYGEDESSDVSAQRLDSEAFKEQGSFEGWDFDRVWSMGSIRPLLRFENSCIYSASDSSEEHIGTLIIAKPEAGQTVIAASTNSDGRLTDARAVTLASTSLPFSFVSLDFDPAADETYLYYWSKTREPLSDRSSPADIAAINE